MKSLPLQVRLMPLFRSLDDETFDQLSRSCSYKRLARGDVLCNKGDASNGLFVLLRGQLRVIDVNRDGQEVGLNILKGPAVFGELGVIDGSPRSADIVAMGSAEVATIPKSIILRCFTESPDHAQAMFRHLTGMVRRLTAHQNMLVMPSAAQRVCAILIDLARRHPFEESVEFELPKQKELASMVNTTRETVSRTLSQLVEQQVVKKGHGKMSVLQMETLKQWAGME